MNTTLLQALNQIVTEYGSQSLADPRRVKALLADLAAGEPKPQKNALIACLDQGFPALLQNVPAKERGSAKATLAERLNREEGLDMALCGDTLDLLEAALFGKGRQEQMKVLCRNCGKELQVKWNACPYCGAPSAVPVPAAPIQPEPPPVEKITVQTPAPQPVNIPVGKRRKALSIFAASVIISGLVIAGWYVYDVAVASGAARTVDHSTSQTAPYEAVTINKTTVLFPDLGKKSPRMELSLVLLEPAGDELLKSLLYEGLSPEAYADHLIRDYEDSYFDTRSQAESPDGSLSEALNWTYRELHKVQVYSRLQVISRFKDYYIGGAHGMREKNYFVVDLVEKKQIQLKDLFIEGAGGTLKTRVEDALRVYAELEPGAPLSSGYYFNDSVEPSENFFLTPEGIGFYWNLYEIAPYSAGAVKIVIPYKNIEDLLNSRGKFLISQLN